METFPEALVGNANGNADCKASPQSPEGLSNLEWSMDLGVNLTETIRPPASSADRYDPQSSDLPE